MSSCYFDFERDGDEEEKSMIKGIDPGLEASGMKTRSLSFEMCRFLLKRYETAFPLVEARFANPHGYGPIHPFGQHTCGVQCRPFFIRVGHYYICRSSGNFHFCPPDGCKEGVVLKGAQTKHCPITGKNSYEFEVDTFESTAGLKRKQPGDGDTDYESMAQMNDPDEVDEEVQVAKRAKTSTTPGVRLSKEGQQSTAKDIQRIQSKADAVVQSLLPAAVLVGSVTLRWIVDEHVLYLWKVILQTPLYQQHSMRYKIAQHVQVVLDGMIDGLAIEKRVVIPQVAVVRQAVLDRKVLSIQPDLASKKFFNAALKEALGEDAQERSRRLEVIDRRG
jgi:hypothetical protein